MTPKETRNAIAKRVLAAFNSIYFVAVDNIKTGPPPIPAPWIRLTIVFNEGNQNTLGLEGNRKFVKLGMASAQVFTPINKGTDLNDDIANEALNLLDGVRIDKLWMYNGRIKTRGSDGEYYRQDSIVEFEFEEIR